jgi:predicted tellurium resistance membrane protein TerC
VHNSLEGDAVDQSSGKTASFFATLAQIAIIDIVFSLDSVITAVGLAEHVETMIAAIVTSVVVMMFAAASIARFVDEHPTIKMLALSFLMLIGFTLMADGVGAHVPKGYIYFAMAFAFGVELLNIRQKDRQAPVKLRRAQLNDLMDDD